MSVSGISWAICKSAPRSRQITTPAPHHSVFLQTGCPSCRPTPPLSFLQTGCPSCRPTNSVKAQKATVTETVQCNYSVSAAAVCKIQALRLTTAHVIKCLYVRRFQPYDCHQLPHGADPAHLQTLVQRNDITSCYHTGSQSPYHWWLLCNTYIHTPTPV